MLIDESLRGPAWTCQWRCPFLGEMNRVRQQDLPPGIESLADLPRHLICHGCQMDLGTIPRIHFVVHQTCPTAIRQTKKFTIHLWPDALSAVIRDACLSHPPATRAPHAPRSTSAMGDDKPLTTAHDPPA